MIHAARNIHSNAKAGGRKSPLTEKHIKAYEMYINGEIGNKKLCELVSKQNPDKPYRPMETAVFKKWIKQKGILKVRNILDIAMTNSEVKEGRKIGEIEFTDGSKKPILFHETGMNNVDYEKRSYTGSPIQREKDRDRLKQLYKNLPKKEQAQIDSELKIIRQYTGVQDEHDSKG